MATEIGPAPAVRPPRVGDTVRYQGDPAIVIRVYPPGASWMPSHLLLPVDLQVDRGHLTHSTTMTPHGVNSGWSWPDESPIDGGLCDDAQIDEA